MQLWGVSGRLLVEVIPRGVSRTGWNLPTGRASSVKARRSVSVMKGITLWHLNVDGLLGSLCCFSLFSTIICVTQEGRSVCRGVLAGISNGTASSPQCRQLLTLAPHLNNNKKAQSNLCLSLLCSPSHFQTLVCPVLFLGILACPTK